MHLTGCTELCQNHKALEKERDQQEEIARRHQARTNEWTRLVQATTRLYVFARHMLSRRTKKPGARCSLIGFRRGSRLRLLKGSFVGS